MAITKEGLRHPRLWTVFNNSSKSPAVLRFSTSEAAEDAKKVLEASNSRHYEVLPPRAANTHKTEPLSQKGFKFKVQWEIYLGNEDAETPEEAAKLCQKLLRRRNSTLSVFSVTDETGKTVIVDLLD